MKRFALGATDVTVGVLWNRLANVGALVDGVCEGVAPKSDLEFPASDGAV